LKEKPKKKEIGEVDEEEKKLDGNGKKNERKSTFISIGQIINVIVRIGTCN